MPELPNISRRSYPDDVAGYLRDGLDAFARDPADSDFQRGYEAALEEMWRVFVVGRT